MNKPPETESLGKLLNTHIDCGPKGKGYQLKIGVEMVSFDLVHPVRESSKYCLNLLTRAPQQPNGTFYTFCVTGRWFNSQQQQNFHKKNCVNYQLDKLLIKGVVGSTIKTRQPKNVGGDRQESSTIKQVTRGPLESYTGGQKLQKFFLNLLTLTHSIDVLSFEKKLIKLSENTDFQDQIHKAALESHHLVVIKVTDLEDKVSPDVFGKL